MIGLLIALGMAAYTSQLKLAGAANVGRAIAVEQDEDVVIPQAKPPWPQAHTEKTAYTEYAQEQTGWTTDRLFQLDRDIRLVDASVKVQEQTKTALTMMYGDVEQDIADAIPAASLSDLPMVSFAGGPIGAPVPAGAASASVPAVPPIAALLIGAGYLYLRAKS